MRVLDMDFRRSKNLHLPFDTLLATRDSEGTKLTEKQWMGPFLNGDFELRHAIPYLMTPFFWAFKGVSWHLSGL